LADTIVLVGGDTLLGREVREVFGESSLGAQLRLLADEQEESGKLTAIRGEISFLAKPSPEDLAGAGVVVLAGTPESAREALAAKPSGVVVDLTYAAEEDPDARVRAPQLEGHDYELDLAGPQIVAHPAAVAIAIVLERLHHAFPLANSIVHVFEPASERGKAGIDELQEQTVSLLSLKQLPKKVFDTQLSFTMLAQFGEKAGTKLAEIEDRIERHLASLLDRTEGVPMPSLRLIQAPVFHGYSFSLWIEFEDAPPIAELEEVLHGDPIDLRGADVEPPSNVSVAGMSGVSIGPVAPDRNYGNAVWMWMAVDNLRLAAETAARIVQEAL